MDSALYRDSGLDIYEKAHYSHGEHLGEIDAILSWYKRKKSRVLDLGCGGGLHSLELARRGHRVKGVDREPSAIALARERSGRPGLAADFFVADLEHYDITRFGRFDLIYSLGNVISHIPKKTLSGLLAKVRNSLEKNGIFLFDILSIGESFPEVISEQDLGITWERRLDWESGEILLKGTFERFGVTQEFRVWGHTMGEMTELLRGAGFGVIEVSSALDFTTTVSSGENPACLRYRARPPVKDIRSPTHRS